MKYCRVDKYELDMIKKSMPSARHSQGEHKILVSFKGWDENDNEIRSRTYIVEEG